MKNDSSQIYAALITAKTVAAISSIQVVGDKAGEIIHKIFKGQAHRSALAAGSILHGNIYDDDTFIDEVIIGCEDEDSFSINCHGNPIIVENILELLKKEGAKITEAKDIVAYLARKKYGDNTIAIESEITAVQSVTLDGVSIIRHQTKMGLLQTANWWLDNLDTIKIEDIRIGAEQVLDDSRIALFFIRGAKVVITGPPNSGKSTLFNYLCGKEKAIVTDIAGTTRDWLSAKIRLKKIEAEFFDTAGLDEMLSGQNVIDSQSQEQAMALIKSADLVLYVLDGSTMTSLITDFTENIKNSITCINKCDLKHNIMGDGIRISAKTGNGIKELIEEVEIALGVLDYDMKKTVCFTERQEKIMRQIACSQDKKQIKELVSELFKSPL